MNKKYIFLAVLTLLLGYCANNAWNQHKIEVALEAKQKAVVAETNQAIADAIRKNNANYEWIKAFQSDSFRNRVLTIELENLWPPERPIFFPGTIKDVVTKDSATYTVFVRRSLALAAMRVPPIDLVLDCDKGLVDGFLSNHKDLLDDGGFKNNVAVIADINSVRQSDDRVMTAYGKCVDLLRDLKMQERVGLSTYGLE